MTGHIDRHAWSESPSHDPADGGICLRRIFKCLHGRVQHDWQQLRVIIDFFGQRLMHFYQPRR